ncbi:hypothetical protein JHK82_042752 [Glycine max]|nr:hypothetical protein JHK87_042665 [Glycine soja]KAG4949541.1 hypothetical protein JHK86_042780 [Glycine max]KAG5105782.1 hypothetical protein JHK82_042752 [Glycine max]KAG5116881.1 hypothetical protein JHK84_042994 [Glycine max]
MEAANCLSYESQFGCLCEEEYGDLGTTKIKKLNKNTEALTVKLSEKDPREISEAVPITDVAGGRYYNGLDHFSWKYANTPPKDSKIST